MANAHQEILEFVQGRGLAVISTLGPAGTPQAAVIGFGETEALEIVFGTFNTSRKYANLQRRPEVALVMGWEEDTTVQYEGVARELAGAEAEKYAEIYYQKSPDSRKYREHPEERYFLVSPRWVRYTDLNVEPWRILELRFGDEAATRPHKG